VRKRINRTNALLASHDGHIPHDLPLLGYIYLLKILSEMDNLKKRLHYHSEV